MILMNALTFHQKLGGTFFIEFIIEILRVHVPEIFLLIT